MANAHVVDVSQGSEHLVGVNLPKHIGELVFDFVIVAEDFVESVWNVVHNQVEVDVVLLLFSLGKEVLIDLDAIGMVEFLDDLEFPVSCLLYTSPSPRDKRQSRMPSSA